MTTGEVQAAEATASRRFLAPLLGPALPYLLHMRPAEWPVMAAHTLLGWLLAMGFAFNGDLVIGMVAWVIGLNGGTLALNSAFDRDTGDVAYLRRPPVPPRGLAVFGLAMMIGGLVLGWTLPVTWRILYMACVVMSIAYSVPPVRLKRVAGVDWAINMLGFGVFSPWAAWAVSGLPLDTVPALILWAFCPLFAALYPLTQLYQIDEDRARGDHTLVIMLGRSRSLAVSLAMVAVSFALLAAAVTLTPAVFGDPRRIGALVLALLAWLVVLVPWVRDGHDWSSAMHQRGMYHALGAWALTDIAVITAWVI